MEKIRIGTSGYSYPYWKNRFYPSGLAASRQLEYYASRFNALELNYTFYRFPSVKALQKASASVPDDFKFSVKAHKIITHTLRMKDAKQKVSEFIDIVLEGLGEKLSCILFQLPPSFHYSEQAIADLLESVAHNSRTVVEFRHASWWTPIVYDTLKAAGISFCSVSYPGLPEDNIMTTDVFYKRMHGVPELFKSSYDTGILQQLAADLPEEGTSFVFFNNTMYEAGYSNAIEFKGLIGQL